MISVQSNNSSFIDVSLSAQIITVTLFDWPTILAYSRTYLSCCSVVTGHVFNLFNSLNCYYVFSPFQRLIPPMNQKLLRIVSYHLHKLYFPLLNPNQCIQTPVRKILMLLLNNALLLESNYYATVCAFDSIHQLFHRIFFQFTNETAHIKTMKCDCVSRL